MNNQGHCSWEAISGACAPACPAWRCSGLQTSPLSAVLVNTISFLHQSSSSVDYQTLHPSLAMPWVQLSHCLWPGAGFASWLFLQLRRLLLAVTLMHISQQSAESCSHHWASLLVCSWPALATCACSGKELFLFWPVLFICFLSHLEINVGFSPSRFCDMCESLLQVLHLVYLTDTLRSFSKGTFLMIFTTISVKYKILTFTDRRTIDYFMCSNI